MLQYPGSPRKINDKIYFERHLRTCSQEPTQHERTCCTMLQYPGSPKKINDNIYVKRHPQCDFSAFLFGASGGQGLVRARNLSGGCYGKVLKTFHNQGLVLLPESSDNFVRLQCCFVWRCGYIPNTFTHACSTDGTAISNMYNWQCIYIYIIQCNLAPTRALIKISACCCPCLHCRFAASIISFSCYKQPHKLSETFGSVFFLQQFGNHAANSILCVFLRCLTAVFGWSSKRAGQLKNWKHEVGTTFLKYRVKCYKDVPYNCPNELQWPKPCLCVSAAWQRNCKHAVLPPQSFPFRHKFHRLCCESVATFCHRWWKYHPINIQHLQALTELLKHWSQTNLHIRHAKGLLNRDPIVLVTCWYVHKNKNKNCCGAYIYIYIYILYKRNWNQGARGVGWAYNKNT